jgi:hypothetical protein
MQESLDIILTARPLVQLTNVELSAVVQQANYLYSQAESFHDPEGISAKLLMVSAHKLQSDALLEIAYRN